MEFLCTKLEVGREVIGVVACKAVPTGNPLEDPVRNGAAGLAEELS
jgi:hypothetical protein